LATGASSTEESADIGITRERLIITINIRKTEEEKIMKYNTGVGI